MVELSNPVVYGMSTNTNGYGYTILRCGAPLTLDGRYPEETEELFLHDPGRHWQYPMQCR